MTEPLLPSFKQAPDQLARDTALDIMQSWIVEAPAGSGKTGLLIQRFLKLLAEADVESPEQVLAITFTLKATAEMRHRISQALEDAAASLPSANFPLADLPLPGVRDLHQQTTRSLALKVLARDAERNWQLLRQPARLNVRTIDSIGAEIAGRLPVLSGTGARMDPLEDAKPLYREAARRTLAALGTTHATAPYLHDSLRTLLLHRDGNLADCESLLAEILPWRDQWGRLVPLGEDLSDERLEAHVKPKLEHALCQIICRSLEELEELFPTEDLDELSLLTHGAAQELEREGRESKIEVWLGRSHAPTCVSEDLDAWAALGEQLLTSTGEWRKPGGVNISIGYKSEPQAKAAKQALLVRLSSNEALRSALDAVRKLPAASYPPEQWQVAKALFRLLQWSMVQLRLLFAETGQCDFVELALAAQQALDQSSGQHDLAAAMGTRIQHLLVDEMQDTSVSQYELLKSLTSGWDGRSQTVFLVGDPKQSIYLFRQARVELFERTALEGLGSMQLGRIKLTANFRSQANLVNQFNIDFRKLFPDVVSLADDVAFTEAQPVRPATDTQVQWHTQVYEGDRLSPETRRQAQALKDKEAEQILTLLRNQHERAARENKPAPRIAVLVRARSHLERLARALRRDGTIPFRAVNVEPLAEQQEVLDVLSLTRALLHPADRVAWLSILRAPWCGLTLADLHTLTGSDDTAFERNTISELIATRAHLLSEDGHQRLLRTHHILQAATKQRDRTPLPQWVERTWYALGGESCVHAQGKENVQAYLRLLDALDDQISAVNMVELQQRMQDLHAAPVATDDRAVELMSIHGAKGLEWDVVIVPAMERRGGTNQSKLLAWLEVPNPEGAAAEEATLAVLAPVQAKGTKNVKLNQWIHGLQRQREESEQKRLYYVVCTRAREELHLFATARQTKQGYEVPAQSLLKTAWAVAEEHFNAAAMPPPVEAQDNLLAMPTMQHEESRIVSLAASAETTRAASDTRRPMMLKRLPLNFFAAASQDAALPESAKFSSSTNSESHGALDAQSADDRFVRPHGSLAARALGNVVHAFLDKLAAHFAAGGTRPDAETLLPRWRPRIAALLRNQGLAPQQVERQLETAMRALQNTLDDPHGVWILAAHAGGASEAGLHAWSDAPAVDEALQRVRLDRVFYAGAAPLGNADTSSKSHLWIIDYKTAEHIGEGIAAFLEGEKSIYHKKMESYARIKHMEVGEGITIHLGLYYPLMREFVSWTFKPA